MALYWSLEDICVKVYVTTVHLNGVRFTSSLPYTTVHNEGGKIKQHVREYTRHPKKGKAYQVRAHSRTLNMPQRQFIEYTGMLRANRIRISMTQTGDPLHNALAERMNNTLKNGWFFNNGQLSFEEARTAVENAVRMYNDARPHASIGMRTPGQVMQRRTYNPLVDSYTV